jgi:hypothetical protein
MKVKILDSRPISGDLENNGLTRRAMFRSTGLVVVGAVVPAFVAREADAQWINTAVQLISAAVSAVDLYKALWQVREPTKGTVTFINNNDHLREGDFWLGVMAATYGRSQYNPEDSRLLPFRVPAGREITYEFYNGPFGWSPGQKYLEGRTQRGTYRTNMTVEL